MALRKPSDLFKKEEAEEINLPVVQPDDTLRQDLNRVEDLSNQVLQLQQELSQKVVKNDLETLVLSQINEMREKFEILQSDIKKSNSNDFEIFNEQLNEISNVVNNLIYNEISKYKKQITKNEIVIGDKVDQIKEVVEENIVSIRQDLDSKIEEIAEVIDNNNDYVNQQLEETSLQVKETKKIYSNLSKIVENRVSKENEKLEEYSQTIENIRESFNQLSSLLREELFTSQQDIEEKFELYKEELFESQKDIEEKFNQTQNQVSDFIDTSLENYRKELINVRLNREDIEEKIEEELETYKEEVSKTQNKLSNFVESSLENYRKDLSNVKADVVINEQHLKKVESYIKENHSQIIELREEVFEEIEKLPVGNLQENIQRLENKIDYIRETYSKIEPEVVVREVIKEGLLNEPPETKNSDPLTPLNQNFVTLNQLQEHYRLFINRIQQQLSTLGGGGETRFKYLDDIVGIATDPSSYDGKFLKYDHSLGKFVFENVSGSGVNLGLVDLNDIDLPTIADNKYLKYNQNTGKFEFDNLDITDFSIDIDGGVSSTIHEPLEFIVAEGGNASTNFYQTDLTIGGGGA